MAGAGGVYTGGGATVVMEPPSLVYVKVFRAASGPDRFVKRKAEQVAVKARMLAPVRSGALKASIRADQNRTERGQYTFGYSVSASTPYVTYVHEGTGPSPRWPNTRKVMKWGDRFNPAVSVYRDFVMHPGTPAQPFLQNALVAVVV